MHVGAMPYLRAVEVPADGRCFFHSVLCFLGLSKGNTSRYICVYTLMSLTYVYFHVRMSESARRRLSDQSRLTDVVIDTNVFACVCLMLFASTQEPETALCCRGAFGQPLDPDANEALTSRAKGSRYTQPQTVEIACAMQWACEYSLYISQKTMYI